MGSLLAQADVLTPDASALFETITAAMIVLFVAGWVFAIRCFIGLRRVGLHRWATAVIVLSVFFSPLAGIVVYFIATSGHQPREA